MSKTLIVERGSTLIPESHPLVVAGGVLPADINTLDWNAEPATQNYARYATLPAYKPRIIKFHGCLKLTADCLNSDTYGKATVDAVWRGMLNNRLDVAAEAALLDPFAQLYSGGPKAEWFLVDFEPGSIVWVPDCPDDPDLAAKWQNALDRRNDLLTRIFTTPKTRKYIGNDISDIPWDSAGIVQCFNWMANPNFDRHQCALTKWMNTLYMQALKDLLSLCKMWGPKVVMAFQGKWAPGFRDNKWSLPQTKLTAPMQSNWQMYDQGFSDLPRKYVASKSVRWVPTWSGNVEPEELRALLTVCTAETAILYCENPDRAAALAPVIQEWLK